MERRSTKTTNLGEEIANIGGSAHAQFNHAVIKITPTSEIRKYSENASGINREDKNDANNKNEGIKDSKEGRLTRTERSQNGRDI